MWRAISEFEPARDALLGPLHPGTRAPIRAFMHERPPSEKIAGDAGLLAAYVDFLGGAGSEVPRLKRLWDFDVLPIAINVVLYDLPSAKPRMPRETAESLAQLWFGSFGERTYFLGNIESAIAIPAHHGGDVNLFWKDMEAGVVGVSPTRVGLLWNAQDS